MTVHGFLIAWGLSAMLAGGFMFAAGAVIFLCSHLRWLMDFPL